MFENMVNARGSYTTIMANTLIENVTIVKYRHTVECQ